MANRATHKLAKFLLATERARDDGGDGHSDDVADMRRSSDVQRADKPFCRLPRVPLHLLRAALQEHVVLHEPRLPARIQGKNAAAVEARAWLKAKRKRETPAAAARLLLARTEAARHKQDTAQNVGAQDQKASDNFSCVVGARRQVLTGQPREQLHVRRIHLKRRGVRGEEALRLWNSSQLLQCWYFVLAQDYARQLSQRRRPLVRVYEEYGAHVALRLETCVQFHNYRVWTLDFQPYIISKKA